MARLVEPSVLLMAILILGIAAVGCERRPRPSSSRRTSRTMVPPSVKRTKPKPQGKAASPVKATDQKDKRAQEPSAPGPVEPTVQVSAQSGDHNVAE